MSGDLREYFFSQFISKNTNLQSPKKESMLEQQEPEPNIDLRYKILNIS